MSRLLKTWRTGVAVILFASFLWAFPLSARGEDPATEEVRIRLVNQQGTGIAGGKVELYELIVPPPEEHSLGARLLAPFFRTNGKTSSEAQDVGLPLSEALIPARIEKELVLKATSDGQGNLSFRIPKSVYHGSSRIKVPIKQLSVMVITPLEKYVAVKLTPKWDGSVHEFEVKERTFFELQGYVEAEEKPVDLEVVHTWNRISEFRNLGTPDFRFEKGVTYRAEVDWEHPHPQWFGSLRAYYDQKVWSSGVFAFETKPGTVSKVHRKLHPWIKIAGRLDDRVPRPIEGGRVFVTSVPDVRGLEGIWKSGAPEQRFVAERFCQTNSAPIDEEGQFVVECPATDAWYQFVARGDGFLNEVLIPDAFAELVNRYETDDGRVVGNAGNPKQRLGWGSFCLSRAVLDADIVIPTVPVERLVIQCVDANEIPVPGVVVSFELKHLRWGELGSSKVDWYDETPPEGDDQIEIIRMLDEVEQQLDSDPVSSLRRSFQGPSIPRFRGVSDADGLIRIDHVPPLDRVEVRVLVPDSVLKKQGVKLDEKPPYRFVPQAKAYMRSTKMDLRKRDLKLTL